MRAVAVAAAMLGLTTGPAVSQTAPELAASLRAEFSPMIGLNVHYAFLFAIERCGEQSWAFTTEDAFWVREKTAERFVDVAQAQKDLIWGLVVRDLGQRLVMSEERCAIYREAAVEVYPERFAAAPTA